MHQKAVIRDFTPAQTLGCNTAIPESTITTFFDESVSLTDYVIAANIQRRYDLGGSRWWEPTAGFRFTYSDFGGNAVTLGLKDGHILRLQGGVRVGHDQRMKDHILTTSLGAFLYSDVLVEGYSIGTAGLPVSGAEVDEGKIRAMGQVNFKIDTLNGLSYYWQGTVRGGEDLFGATGKVGVRWEW